MSLPLSLCVRFSNLPQVLNATHKPGPHLRHSVHLRITIICPSLPNSQVLNASSKPDLIRATLSTLHAFLSWVPLGYIFESNVTEVGCTGQKDMWRFAVVWGCAGWGAASCTHALS